MGRMRIRVRLYAILHELYGKREDEIEVPDTATVAEVLARLSSVRGRFGEFIRERSGSLIILVNGLYATMDHRLSDGDVVDILPPSSGGLDSYLPCVAYELVEESKTIDLAEIVDHARLHARTHGLGALNIYVGIVKSPVDGKDVRELRYEVHREYTLRRFSEIAKDIWREYGVGCIRIYHRIGNLAPGDIALIVVLQGRGREEVFNAMPKIVDMIKHTTGIWKLEIREDGAFWVIGGNERIESREI